MKNLRQMKKILIILALALITRSGLSQVVVVFETELNKKIETIQAYTYNIESLNDIIVRVDTLPEVEGGILPPTFSIKRLYGDFLAKNQGLPASLIKEIIVNETKNNRVSLMGNIFMFKDEQGETYVVFLKYMPEEKKWFAEELKYNTYESQFDTADLKKPAMNLKFSDKELEDSDQIRPEKGMILFGRT